jgi:hypothetical protein
VLKSLSILVAKPVGEEGAVGVVTVTVAGTEIPIIFVAVTSNVYSVLTDNPVNVNDLVNTSVVPDKLPGDPVILYSIIGLLPSEVGTLHETVQSQVVLVILVILVSKLVGEEGAEGAGISSANNDRVRPDT